MEKYEILFTGLIIFFSMLLAIIPGAYSESCCYIELGLGVENLTKSYEVMAGLWAGIKKRKEENGLVGHWI